MIDYDLDRIYDHIGDTFMGMSVREHTKVGRPFIVWTGIQE